jgi:hypothetical protein
MYKVGKVSCDTISQARTRGFGLEVMQPKPMWAQLGKSRTVNHIQQIISEIFKLSNLQKYSSTEHL